MEEPAEIAEDACLPVQEYACDKSKSAIAESASQDDVPAGVAEDACHQSHGDACDEPPVEAVTAATSPVAARTGWGKSHWTGCALLEEPGGWRMVFNDFPKASIARRPHLPGDGVPWFRSSTPRD